MLIDRIEVFGFRGLRDFCFDFQENKALIIYGLNGTGKSSLYQAINFAITGKLPFVSSVESSSPVIYRHKALNKNIPAYVCLHLSCNSCKCWIRREIHSNERLVTNTSNNNPIESCGIAKNTLCFLTRVGFTNMVDTVERESWQRLSPFLGHEKLAKFREGIKSLSYNIKRDLGLSQIEENIRTEYSKLTLIKTRYETLCKQLSIETLTLDVLKEELRKIITKELPEFSNIKDVSWDLIQTYLPGSEQIIDITEQIQELSEEVAVIKMINLPNEEFKKSLQFLDDINSNAQLRHDLLHEKFLTTAYSTIINLTNEPCPLCGMSPKNWGKVKESMKERIADLSKSIKKFEATKKCLETYKAVLSVSITNIFELASRKTISNELIEYRNKLQIFCDMVELCLNRLNSIHPLGLSKDEIRLLEDHKKNAIEAYSKLIDYNKNTEIKLKTEQEHLSSNPQTEKFFQLKELSTAYLDFVSNQANYTYLKKKELFVSNIVEKVQSFYKSVDVAESKLSEMILTRLENEIARIFTVITDQGQLIPKISIKTVRGIRLAEILIKDFHGLGTVNAREYLSEANRNSLGLSIYFAGLLSKTPKLQTLVIDDITHSSDNIHRRGLSNFIVNELSSKFQLIIFTHDKHWYDRILSTLPSNQTISLEVIDWTPDGLTYKTDKWGTLLDKASNKIRNHDQTGGNALRQALEKFIDEICEKLYIEFPYKQSPESIKLNEKRQKLEKAIKDIWATGQGIIDPNRPEIRLILNSQKITNFASHYGSYDSWDHQDLLDVLKDVSDLINVFICKNSLNGSLCGGLLSNLKKVNGNSPICLRCKKTITL